MTENHFGFSLSPFNMDYLWRRVAAVFCIAGHYIFNLTYHRKTGDFWLFIQEKILGLLSKAGVKCVDTK